MAILPVGIGSAAAGGYQIERSLRFNSADSAYLSRTLSSSGNMKVFTLSFWLKRTALSVINNLFTVRNGIGSGTEYFQIKYNSDDTISVIGRDSGSVTRCNVSSTAVFRDPGAWAHIVISFNASSTTLNVYANNVVIANSTSIGNVNYGWNNSALTYHRIGDGALVGEANLNGYMTELYHVDGQALTPSDFGETDSATGVWKPKAFSGTYGTNGFYLPFKTASQWSGYFDGTGDYLTVANNSALNFGTSAFTVECWFYRTSSAAIYGLWSLNSTTSGYAGARAQINTNGSIDIYISQNGSSWANSITNRGSTTVNTWNHLAVVRESNGDIKIYINGTQAGATVTNANSLYAGTSHLIGGIYSAGSPSSVFPGYISNFRSVVGTAVYTGTFTPPTSQLTAITNTQLLTCQSSTFVDNSTNALTITASGDSKPQQFSPFTLDVTDDHSGQGNHWQPNNLDLRTTGTGADILVDTPTSYGTDTGVGGEVRGNYCTLNPIFKNADATYGSVGTFINGNLEHSSVGSSTNAWSTFAVPTSGKWYWEVRFSSLNSASVGIFSADGNVNRSVLYTNTGTIAVNNSTTQSGLGSWTSGDTIGIAYDAGAATVQFYRQGSTQGTAASVTSYTFDYLPFARCNAYGEWNFGQRAFAYTAPSGFKALCTQNLPTPAIGATSTTQANKYFNTVLYTGNGNASRSITGVGFQPDFVWAKARSAAYYNGLFDAVRSGYALYSNSTDAEDTTEQLTFGSDGFTTPNKSGDFINTNSATYVAWNWNAGGSNATNTSGTITSTVRANTTSGFSIVTYTGNGSAGARVGHGLGVAPSMIIVKQRGGTTNWAVYHASLPSAFNVAGTQVIYLNATTANTQDFNVWDSNNPLSTYFSIGASTLSNANTGTYVAYCFAAVAGYSAFGSYTGNGSADGPFIYTGFRPAFVLIKRSSAIESWCLMDCKREGYNVDNDPLYPNLSNAEGTQDFLDLLSNGFKLRSTDTGVNGSGTYIYAAFAESPFKYSLAR